MPGHKGSKEIFHNTEFQEKFLEIDLTEVEGVDSLFHPTGSLKQAQENVAELYKTKESIFLVNGASVGILASIMSIVEDGDEIIVPRNAHRSVYNALFLTGAKPVYLLPEIDKSTGIAMGINSDTVEKALQDHPKAKGVLLSHPNFYGLCSDIDKITEIVHRHNKVIIVDEACGSHFKFHKELPISGIDAGADIVVHGTHKNLPAMTQSGILHINSERVDVDRLKDYLMILQTSSPSYVLLSSLEIALAMVHEKGNELFQMLYDNITWFVDELKVVDGIKILNNSCVGNDGIVASDLSKVIINFNHLNISGYEVEAILNKCGIQCELSDPKNILLTFTIADSREVFGAVLSSIKEIMIGVATVVSHDALIDSLWHVPEVVFTPKGVRNIKGTRVFLEDSLGLVSLNHFSPFPPAVPIIRAGERIDERVIKLLKKYNAPQTINVWDEAGQV